MTYCGVALVGVDSGTNMADLGVRRGDMVQIKVAVEAGDFFCTCRRLSI